MIEEIQRRVDAARIAQARAEATLAAAKENKDSAMTALKDKFGLDSLDAARAKLTELTALRDQLAQEIDDKLKQIGF